MSDERPEPDVVVETALRLLPVPDHEPGFWTRLEATLDAEPDPRTARMSSAVLHDTDEEGTSGPGEEPGRASPGGPGHGGSDAVPPAVELQPPPAVGVVPPAMRRRSNLVLSALAVAAAVAVVVAGASLVRSRTGESGRDEETAGTEAADGTPDAAPEVFAAPADEPAAVVVVDWINAVAAGEVEDAWALLGPRSQADWGSFDAFAAERTGLAEGYGAWRVADPEVIVTPLVEDGEEQLVVVTLVGAVPQEGTTQMRADAFPVRLVGDRGVLELYDSAGVMEIVVPEDVGADGSLPVLDTTAEIILVVPGGVSAPVLRLGDGPVLVCGEAPGTELTPLEGTSGQRCGYTPAEGLPPGDHALLAAFTSVDGRSVTAHGAAFTVR